MKNIICANDVRYTVEEGMGTRNILDGVTYNFQKSKITTISGPSGSGKTTLLYSLAGLLNFIAGSVTVNNQSLYAMKQTERDDFRLKNISMVFQNLNLFSFMNVEENILTPFYIKNKKVSKDVRDKISMYLDLMGLNQIQKKSIQALSGGEQQRVAIIRAIIDNAAVIICDEPTASLDQKNTEVFMDTLVKMKEKTQTTIIIATHNERVFKYGDDKVHMLDGIIM